MLLEEEGVAPPKVYARWSDRLWFTVLIASAIVFNAMQMGLELQFETGAWKTVWNIFENFFTAFFLGEMTIKIVMDGYKDYFGHRANLLDCVIVFVAIIDNWILIIFLTDEEKDKLSFLSVMKLVRLGRILKL